MAIRRITLSVPEAVASRIKKAAGDRSVSAWVTEVVEHELDSSELETQFTAFCEAHPASRTEKARAESILGRLRAAGSSRKRTA